MSGCLALTVRPAGTVDAGDFMIIEPRLFSGDRNFGEIIIGAPGGKIYRSVIALS